MPPAAPATMADLHTLHTQAKRLILTIRAGLERLETAEVSARSMAPSGLATELQQQLQQLQASGLRTLMLCTFRDKLRIADIRSMPTALCVTFLQRLSGELDAVWRMQSLREPAAKRDIWKRKVEQV